MHGFTAFGKYQHNSATTNAINPFGYNGEVTDSDAGTDLIYLRNRYYDPSMGRFITEDPIKDGTNWYAYCNNDPVNFVDPWGLDAIVLLNRNGAASSTSNGSDGVSMGHMAIIVQNADGNWHYFSCGDDYIALKPVNTNDLSDLKTFSEKYYWENMYYTDATYIKGILNDGTKVSTFIITDTTYENQLTGTPNSIMNSLQKIFYNSEFTREASHKTINDLLWEKQSGPWWKRNSTMAKRLEKLY